MLIKQIKARKILDSRGEPTIEVLVNGCKASSPSGKSKGRYETPSYRMSLAQNISDINNLKKSLRNMNINSFADLAILERLIKKHFNFKDVKQFGANALFALESAILKALAKSEHKELWEIINPKARKMPVPLGNAIGGGMHSQKFANHPTFQEFLLIPKSSSIRKNVKTMEKIYSKIKSSLGVHLINDEGALQTPLDNEEALTLLSKFKKDVRIGVDAAASSFYNNGTYSYKNEQLSRSAQIFYINSLIKEHKIFYLEDPLEENDFKGFRKISKKALVCGDDLTTTHISRLKKAISSKSINAMIIKPNQNGSLLEVAEIFKLCKKHNIKTILSHRSGETLDSAIADYAFSFQADFIKTGIETPWRKVKLKRLINIEHSLR